ncbi:ATP-binding protein [Devosia riboflavina]|uniref:ATP-binding protein n=1 Tax=Devosia riboflavina TaxID=46914 RepID=A0A087M3G1_9HYPH|nr:AAA family ATPase [Devosia riboflavina]KFL31414.1 ATP-binding protein [Devosia riboflavina]
MQWSPQQDGALKQVSTWLRDPQGQQVFRLFGWAGTGKSTLAVHLAEEVNTVVFAAFTGKAALVMRKRGCFGASTIHSLIYTMVNEIGGEPKFVLNPDSEIVDADLVVIDEVSMVGAELARDLLSFGKKVLVLGDPFQLPPVKDAGYFTDVRPDIMLTEIHRQAADNPIIRMSMDIREGNGLDFGTYGESKVIRAANVDRDDVLTADQVLCGKNATRIIYNDRIRQLKGMPHREPVPGDRLVCLRNNHQKNLLNGQLWLVKQTFPKGRGNMELLLRPDDAGARAGDALVFTHEKWFQGREEEFDWKDRRRYDEFYFGYALTVHKAQGSQWENVYLFDESTVFRDDRDRHLYTAVTRAAEKITVVA